MSRVTNNLVPIIPKEKFDEEATIFLGKYCPEALEKPIAVPIRKIATEKLKLKIEIHRLSEDLRYFGQMCFTTGLVEVYDDDELYHDILLEKGTMVIDPDTYYKRNIGCMNNTIAHECFHWYKHRSYHFLKAITQSARAVVYRCETNGKNEELLDTWCDEDWMEWQANGIAPRILLPKNTFVQKAHEIISQFPVDDAIRELAKFFEVSMASARIRLIETGIINSQLS